MKAKILAIIVSIIGLIDAVYLIVIKVVKKESLCFIRASDCLSVNNSAYSEIYSFPIAALGAIAFLTILVLLIFELKSIFIGRIFPFAFFGLTLIGVIYSAYLTYLEIAVINAVCPFCVISAVCMLALFILSLFHFKNPPLDY